ncbi:FUSC family protein [Granulicoccus sp. GXG6511]|uniref:FUSC family protein n=1 Tax=Granulicoccus sp. GXG6511 TaxID=3381351 RepID=UPI003D7D9846
MNAAARARDLIRFQPARRRWPIALKAAVAISLPLLVTTLLGHSDLGLIAGLGAFAVLYGADTPGRFRIKLMSAMAASFVISVAVGVVAAAIHPIVLLAVMVVLAALAAAVCVILKIGPPGSYFLVLVCGAGSFLVDQGASPGRVILMTAIGGAVAVIVGMADLVGDPHRPEREAADAAENAIEAFEHAQDPGEVRAARAAASATLHLAWTSFRDGIGERPIDQRNAELFERIGILQTRYTRRSAELAGRTTGAEAQPWGNPEGDQVEAPTLDPEFEAEQLRDSSLGRPDPAYLIKQALRWPSEIRLIAIRVGLAALASGIVALALAFDHSYWGVAFAALVLHQGGSRYAQTLRGVQRLLGTMVGLGVYALIVWWSPHGLWLVLLVFALQFAIEMLIVRNYAAAVVFITPIALTIALAGAPALDPGRLILERGIDTLIAVVLALAVLWLVGGRTSLLFVRAHARRSILATEDVMQDLAESRYASAEARENRRHLYYELLELERGLAQSLADDPRRVEPYRAMVDQVATLGYLVLGACWHPQVRRAREAFGRAVEPLQIIKSHPIDRQRAAADIEADVRRVQQVITDWR